MKSENTWSEKDVDELLTSFFGAEVPGRLSGPMPRLRPTAVTTSGKLVPVSDSVASHSARWMTATMVACAAALVVAVAAFQFGGDAGSVRVAKPTIETSDPVINVGGGTTDTGDFGAPEQNIEVYGETDQ